MHVRTHMQWVNAYPHPSTPLTCFPHWHAGILYGRAPPEPTIFSAPPRRATLPFVSAGEMTKIQKFRNECCCVVRSDYITSVGVSLPFFDETTPARGVYTVVPAHASTLLLKGSFTPPPAHSSPRFTFTRWRYLESPSCARFTSLHLPFRSS